MKTTLLSRFMLAAFAAFSISACGIGTAPKDSGDDEEVVTPPKTKPPVVVPEEEKEDEEEPVVDEGHLQEVLAQSAAKRKAILRSMEVSADWRTKFAISTKWAQALDYQTWKPVKSFKDEKDAREDLFDLALREFFINWETYSREIGDSSRRRIDVNAHDSGVQNIVALALAMDQRNSLQDKYANRYGFEKFSVFGLIRDTLINKRQLNSSIAFENTVGMNEVNALAALEWRMNGLFVWAWELSMDETLSGGIFERVTLDIARLPTVNMTFVSDLLNRATVGANQLAMMKKNLKDADKRAIVLNPEMRHGFARMKFDKADKAAARETDSARRRAAQKMIADLKKVQVWMK